ncbi:hypothetical protein A4A71_09530 [Nicoletella semolina]|uniref:hypothetical protein n=1 Tax=Nicoletella semolina TaxID=271160 RepID=UPI00244B7C5A|nr:hypothetical protein [Nicoletella semolina]MDH2925540.1 hypothetical protein [Nicoletella semolina]
MLNSSGKVTLALNEPNTDSDPIYFGKLNITDDIQLNSFKQADSYLKIFAANKVDILAIFYRQLTA